MRAASLVLLAFAVPALAATKSFRFDAPRDLAAWRLEGKASLDTAKHAAEGGASLRLGPGAKATIALGEENRSGKVSMWVFEDGSAPADPKKYGSGPLWGIALGKARKPGAKPIGGQKKPGGGKKPGGRKR